MNTSRRVRVFLDGFLDLHIWIPTACVALGILIGWWLA